MAAFLAIFERTGRRALLATLIAAACWSGPVHADTYPAQDGRSVQSNGPAKPDDSAACIAYGGGPASGWSWGWQDEQSCGDPALHLGGFVCFVPYPLENGWCHKADDPFSGCHVSCPVQYCPNGGSLSGNLCVNASPCPAGQSRDPETGKCGDPNEGKNEGPPLPCCGNPANAGTGRKFQTELLFSSGNNTPLIERFSYNGRLLTDAALLWSGAYGNSWRGHYERQVRVLATGVAVVRREDGHRFAFNPPASGYVYIGDADVADRLTRLANGAGNTTGWQYIVAADDSSELYGADGKLLSMTNRAGSALTLAYSDASTPSTIAPVPGLLISVTDRWGRAISYIYDRHQRVTQVTDPAGRTYAFGYVNGNLASITFPDLKVRQFLYNEQTHTQNTQLPYSLTGIIDENAGRFATFDYDTQGRVVSTQHANGAELVTLDYTSPYVTTTVTDAFNVARSYGLTTSLGVVKLAGITGPACPTCGPAAQTLDANGNVASRTDWNGNRTNYTFDLARNLETQRVEGLTSSGATTPQTRTITTAWDTNFRLPTQIAQPLRVMTNTYDSDGTQCGARGALCSKTIQATSDANGSLGFSATPVGPPRTWTYTYNTNGSVLTLNGPRTDVSDVTTYTYYASDDPDFGKRGNVATITNALGHLTSVTAYNAHGQPLTIVDPNSMTITLTYDERQRLKSRNAGSELTSYDYDNVGQLTKVTLPDGSYLSYGYDAAHRLTGISDNLGNRISYTLDAMGNRTLEQVFDPVNQLVQTRSRVYNSLNRLFQELGAQSQTTEYGYDDQGNVTSVKDPLTHTTINQYDALNRVKQVTDPSPGLGVTLYAYNGLDALTQVTDPRNLVTGYTIDGLGNLAQQVSPDTGTTGGTYDAAGNLITQTDAKNQITTYAYDALNRVTLITFQDGSKQTYAYDDQATNGIGRLFTITETDPGNQVASVIAYAYDQHGRVTSEARTLSGVQYITGYRYDTFGHLDQVTYPSGRTVNYTFDTLGRISAVDTTKAGGQAQNVLSNVLYHPFGGAKSYTLGNTQQYTRSIDLDGRITSYTLGTQTFAIGYDDASRIQFISETGNPPNTNNYGYDELDRLTSAATQTTGFGYSYDAVGNRISRAAGANTDTYAYSSTSNRIASITPLSGPVRNFTFDPNGSTTADGLNTYGFDTRGRMTSATSSIGTTTYQVNALGQRVRKTNSQTDRVFHYDLRGHLIAETDPGGGLKREVIYLGDIPVGAAQ